MTTIARKPRKPAEITSACIYRCTNKASGTIFYLVPSDSQPGDFHTVRFDEQSTRYTCSCPSYRECRHIKAVESVQQAKRELLAEQNERERKMAAFAMMHIDGIRLNDAGKMYHFIPAEKLPVPARQYEDWSSSDAPIYASDRPVDSSSCRYCGARCRGGVCMDCLDIAA